MFEKICEIINLIKLKLLMILEGLAISEEPKKGYHVCYSANLKRLFNSVDHRLNKLYSDSL